jgi:hypothetical protein
MHISDTPISLSLPVVSVDRLLDTTGSPLATPHLHPEASDALLKLAERSPRGAAMQLEFVVPPQDSHRSDEVRHALATHFQQIETELSHRLQSILREGRVAAIIGFAFVAAVLGIVQIITRVETLNFTHTAVESLTIIAWVALWRPAELLLYDHWPVRRQRQLARRLAQARITLRAR